MGLEHSSSPEELPNKVNTRRLLSLPYVHLLSIQDLLYKHLFPDTEGLTLLTYCPVCSYQVVQKWELLHARSRGAKDLSSRHEPTNVRNCLSSCILTRECTLSTGNSRFLRSGKNGYHFGCHFHFRVTPIHPISETNQKCTTRAKINRCC